MEVLDGIWKLKRDYSYIFHKDRKQEEGNSLKDKDIWMISTRNNEKVSIIVKETDSVFHAYQKYDLKVSNRLISEKMKRMILYGTI